MVINANNRNNDINNVSFIYHLFDSAKKFLFDKSIFNSSLYSVIEDVCLFGCLTTKGNVK
jgi:hypothetical protein